MTRWGRVLTAMVTPYTSGGDVDLAKTQKLTEYLLANGSDAVVVCGTTGENPTLTPQERSLMLDAVLEAAGDKNKVVFGTTTNNTVSSLHVAKEAESHGASGVLAVVPYYNKPPQEGLFLHFCKIAQSTTLPVILYNIPGRTGVALTNDTILRLMEACPNIRTVKDSTGDLNKLADLKRRAGEDLDIYSGDDCLTLPILSVGGCGVISVATHILGKEIKAMVDMFFTGRYEEATLLHQKLMPAFNGLFITANPIPVRACLNLLGWNIGDCRLPLCSPSETELTTLRNLLSSYNLIK